MTQQQINDFLDQMKADLDLKTDVQLADYLKVKPVTIWRWRQGDFGVTKQLLVSYLLDRTSCAA